MRPSARTIDASDLRIDWSSLPTDVRRGLAKRASTRKRAREWYYAAMAGTASLMSADA
jgi:hypothetical protein